jgi:hypothetical protein
MYPGIIRVQHKSIQSDNQKSGVQNNLVIIPCGYNLIYFEDLRVSDLVTNFKELEIVFAL